MNLEPKDLEKLARLARLAMSDTDRQEVLPALTSVVNWVGELASAPTEGVAPMAHPHDLTLRLREDVAVALAPPRGTHEKRTRGGGGPVYGATGGRIMAAISPFPILLVWPKPYPARRSACLS